jgi:hypothetical protein
VTLGRVQPEPFRSGRSLIGFAARTVSIMKPRGAGVNQASSDAVFCTRAGFLKGPALATPLKSAVYRHF